MPVMHGDSPSFAAAAAFTLQWGVMMIAMMLPSATPMILFYRSTSERLAGSNERVIPAWVFALVYVVVWLMTGLPVYAGSVAVRALVSQSSAFAVAIPYLIADTLFVAGVYQLSGAKRACLHQCERPLDFLMRRWRSGYASTLRLAATHAAYCIGCCWLLMVVLVVAGAMSLPFVLTIALVVFAEKILPFGERTARAAGLMLIAASLAVALRPELAKVLRAPRRTMSVGKDQRVFSPVRFDVPQHSDAGATSTRGERYRIAVGGPCWPREPTARDECLQSGSIGVDERDTAVRVAVIGRIATHDDS